MVPAESADEIGAAAAEHRIDGEPTGDAEIGAGAVAGPVRGVEREFVAVADGDRLPERDRRFVQTRSEVGAAS